MWIVILIVVIILLGSIFLNQMYMKTNEYKNTQLDIQKYIEGIPYDLKFVNLGSTYAKYAFDTYDDLCMSGFNFALQSESLEMDEKILHHYVNNIMPDGIVVIVVAACVLLYKGQDDNLQYYKILSKENIPHYKLSKKIKSKYPLFFHPKKIKKIIKDLKKMNSIYDNYPDILSVNNSQKEMDNLVKVWKKLFNLSDLRKSDLSQENRLILSSNCEVLKRMISYCIEKGLRPIVVIPPFSIRLNQYFSDEFNEKIIRDNIMEIIDEINIPFLDYQEDEMFQNSPELFCDGGFKLNNRGSQLFVKHLAFDLKSYGIEVDNSTVGK
ncbi:hypothetical protein [[Clostridium] fimetarium]|uniref:Uncharacterized protein n=1 Tax=[Clostridium] fimetarium TaxID=99656 RepID=A0A1I0RM31_9FIRM|nr:hypothetical protein [[Clostridium] fimetarium]SEW42011.1 hypothetical protein SAMN05421659_11856 [[Clostridium] fimetarium]